MINARDHFIASHKHLLEEIFVIYLENSSFIRIISFTVSQSTVTSTGRQITFTKGSFTTKTSGIEIGRSTNIGIAG